MQTKDFGKLSIVGVLFVLGLCLVAVLASTNASVTDTITIKYSFDYPNIRTINIDGAVYQRVFMPDAPNSGSPGQPALPACGANILIPPGTEVSHVEVIPGKRISLGDGYSIEPMGEPHILSKRPESVLPPIPDQEIYSSIKPFPAVRYEKISTQSFRGYNILVLKLQPVEYVPATGELSYFSDLTVVVHTVENGQRPELFRGVWADREIIKQKVDNPDDADDYPILSRATTGFDLLILTTPALEASFEPLEDYHDSTGIVTEIHTTADVGSSNPDTIRDYIHDLCENDHIQYVLIGGDDDVIPAKDLYVRTGHYQSESIEYNMPGDIYYACLDGTYNYDEDALWGEPTDGEDGGDVDLVADVYVGRAPVGDTTEANRFVAKTIEYLTTSESYLEDVLMCGEDLGFDFALNRWGGDWMDQLLDGSESDGYTTVGIPSNVYTIDSLYDRDRPDSCWPVSEIYNRINDGRHIINHLGHGSEDYAMKMWSDSLMDSLSNTDLCFVYSQTCLAGHFDSVDCWAEYMTVKTDHGAFAAIMNARYGYGYGYVIEGCWDGPDQRYNREFWDAIFNTSEGKPEIGRACNDSREDNLYRINEIAMRWCYYEMTLFGDPTIIFRDAPKLAFEYPVDTLQIPTFLAPKELDSFLVKVVEIADGNMEAGSGLLHYSINGAATQTKSLIDMGDNEFLAILPGLSCGDVIEFYVSVEEAEAGRIYNPKPGSPHRAVPVTDEFTVFEDDFETDKGWSICEYPDADTHCVVWERGTPSGVQTNNGCGDPDSESVPSGVNIYGYNLDGGYGYHDYYVCYLVSPEIDCDTVANVHLKFKRWLGIGEAAGNYASVDVSVDESNWVTVWRNTGVIDDCEWKNIDLDISAVADGQSTVYLRWSMGPFDIYESYCGWNIDDVEVTAAECDEPPDEDDDGICDSLDNCWEEYNPDQADCDSNGVGDVCDTSCNCSQHCDLDGDNDLDPVDVVYIYYYVFQQTDARVQYPCCPGDNGDWDCDGVVDSVDHAYYMDYVYYQSEVGPCDPCDCDPYPSSCPTFPPE